MVENIIEKIEQYNSIRKEIEVKIKEIRNAENNARFGLNAYCCVDEFVKIYLDGETVVVESTDNYEDDGCCRSYEKANKELFNLTNEDLITKFNEQYKDAIEERKEQTRRRKEENKKKTDERDLKEFKRLNKIFRGKNEK